MSFLEISLTYRPALDFDYRDPALANTKSAMTRSASIPATLVDPLALSRLVRDDYSNVSLGKVNDHEIRLSVMTEQFPWHRHPDSDETFYGVDGGLVIEVEDREVVLRPGQFVTVPAGALHRTRPLGERSVNLTFEKKDAETVFEE